MWSDDDDEDDDWWWWWWWWWVWYVTGWNTEWKAAAKLDLPLALPSHMFIVQCTAMLVQMQYMPQYSTMQYMPQCKTCHNLIQATMQHIAQCYTCHNASQKKDEERHHIAFKGDIVGLQCMHCNTWWDEKRQCSEDRNALLQCDEAWLEWRGRTSPSKCTVCCIEVHGRL